jgi:signal transduction histidine kinase
MKSHVYDNKDNLNNFLSNNFSKEDLYDVIILNSNKQNIIEEDIKNNLLKYNKNFIIKIDNINSSTEDIILVFSKINEEIKNAKYIKKMALLGDMIANISHQWRQPLSVITSSASAMILHKDLDILDDKSFEKFANNIISQGQYLAQTIDTFRAYIKKDNSVSEVIIQDEIKTTLKILDAVFSQNYIIVENKTTNEENLKINLIKGEFAQVLINIITNAKDVFISNNIKDKKLIINLKKYENKCIVCIEDNAGGIDEKIIDKIFDKDFTTKQKDGTGIGLSMSYDIVKEHLNGDLYVKNTNNGAKFFIELPL